MREVAIIRFTISKKGLPERLGQKTISGMLFPFFLS